jgi:hypothetical protein
MPSIETLCPTSVRMLLIPYLELTLSLSEFIKLLDAYLIMVGRSKLRPQPCTRTSLGKPIGSSISGRNMPLFPTSTHLSSIGWKANISSDGYQPPWLSIETHNKFCKLSYLGIRIISGFKPYFLDAHLFKEDTHEP